MKRLLAPAALYLAVTLLVTFPLLQHFASALPHDVGDPSLNAWLLSWSTKQLPLTDAWWNGPMFYPAANVVALSELLLGLLPITAAVQWLTHNPLAAYNTAFVLSFPLSALAAYALALELTGRRDAALLSGLAFAFAPYRMGQLGHLQVLSYYWAPLALLGLHRYRRTNQPRWLVLFGGAWLMQSLTNGYALFHLSLLIALWVVWFARRLRSVAAIMLAWTVAALPLVPQLLKYRQVHASLHLARDINEVRRFGVDLADVLSPAPELVLWGSRLLPPHPERAIFPGATMVILAGVWLLTRRRAAVSPEDQKLDEPILLGLAAVAGLIAASVLAFGPWSLGPLTVGDFRKPFSIAVLFRLLAWLRGRWVRKAWREESVPGFYAIAAIAMLILALGPEPRLSGHPILYKPPYDWLMQLPGFDVLRVPARLVMLTLLCVSVLVAFAVAQWSAVARLRFVVPLIAAGIIADGLVRIDAVSVPSGPKWPDSIDAVVEVPVGREGDFAAIFRSLSHGRPIVNGYSGYFPTHYLPFVFAMRDRQFSALGEVSRGHAIGVAVDREGADAVAAERMIGEMAGVSRVASADDRWATFVMQPAVAPDDRWGAELAVKSVSANRRNEDVGRLADRRLDTAWGAGANQIGDEEIRIDLGSEQSIGSIVFEMGAFSFGFPRELVVEVSADESAWRSAWTGRPAVRAVHAGLTDPGRVPLTIDTGRNTGRFIRLRQVGSEPGIPWWIAELKVFAPPAD